MNKVCQWFYHRWCFKSSRDQTIRVKLNGEGCVGEGGGAASPRIRDFSLVSALCRETHHMPSKATISDDAAYVFLLCLS